MRLWSIFSFFNIHSEVVKYVASCEACLLKKRGVDYKRFKYSPSDSGYLNQMVHLDIWVHLIQQTNGYKYILAIKEPHSCYCLFIPLQTISAKVVADAFISRYVAFLAIPNTILSDHGRQCTSLLFNELTESLQITMNLHQMTATALIILKGLLASLDKCLGPCQKEKKSLGHHIFPSSS